jgi:hypothetical protein
MTSDASDPGFKVSDRRRHAGEELPRRDSPRPAEPPPVPAGPESPGDLTGVFLIFASSAMIAMGESPDPMTGQARRNLAEAREAIDILRLLRARTEGNRTPEEEQLLNEVIYDLQVRFVRATTRSS